ncbi:hypothetical protein [Nocardioides solisilvae]|uniref:hypothetical protein n=1 Tax=Nocardioides solisilvae TaxID=1542435 RepID=UPI0013A57A56|nr:hypothetical protein [Nocardioides solisilvae]
MACASLLALPTAVLASAPTASGAPSAATAAASAAAGSAQAPREKRQPTAKFVQPGPAQLGAPHVLRIRVVGHDAVGEPASIALDRIPDLAATPIERVPVERIDLTLTAEPRYVEIPLDTSAPGRVGYVLEMHYGDVVCDFQSIYYSVLAPGQQPDPDDAVPDGWEACANVPKPASVTVARTPKRVAAGTRLRLSGKVRGGTLQVAYPVVVTARFPGGWVPVGRTKTVRANLRWSLRTAPLPAGTRELKVSVKPLDAVTSRKIRVPGGRGSRG